MKHVLVIYCYIINDPQIGLKPPLHFAHASMGKEFGEALAKQLSLRSDVSRRHGPLKVHLGWSPEMGHSRALQVTAALWKLSPAVNSSLRGPAQ